MALAARQYATSFPGRPVGQRARPAGLFVGVATVCTSQVRAGAARRNMRVQAGASPDGRPPVSPPWERAAEDEQLEDIRQRVRRYSQKSDEELLLEQLLKFKEEEAACLQRFAEAEKKGDDAGMKTWHSWWKYTVQKMELLMVNPQAFAKKYGHIYPVETQETKDKCRGAEETERQLRTLLKLVLYIIIAVLALITINTAF